MKTIFLTASAVLCVVTISAEAQNSGTSAQPVVVPPMTSTPSPKESSEGMLKIKGLYIGMDIDDACNIVNSLNDSLFAERRRGRCYVAPESEKYKSIGLVSRGNGYFLMEQPYSQSDLFTDPQIAPRAFDARIIEADSSKKVTKINIDEELANRMFNSSDMSADDFAKAFSSACKISEIKLWWINKDNFGWVYSSPNGWKVNINKDHSILITKIPNLNERGFDNISEAPSVNSPASHNPVSVTTVPAPYHTIEQSTELKLKEHHDIIRRWDYYRR